jgi:poly(3-hydroxybutyrate) depolymerase
VAGLDNVGHGARRHPDFDDRFAYANPSLEHDFVDDVLTTAREVPAVIDALVRDHGADPARLGASGISMGGFVLYAALVVEPRLAVACPILGSPRFKVPHPDSPHHQLHRFYPRAVLSQNAGADRSVPPVNAREFHERLEPFYAEAPERQRYVEFPGADHFMPEADWNRLWGNVLGWFERWL